MSDETETVELFPTLTLTTFGITDRGMVRETNEDQFLIAELSKAMRVLQTSLPEPKLQVGEERAHNEVFEGAHSGGAELGAAVRSAR